MSETPGSPGPWGDPQQWSDPPPGATSGPAGEPPQPPPSILTAVKLMYVGAALAVVSILLTFTQTDEIREEIRESNEELTPSELDLAVNIGITVAVIFGAVAVGLWIWMAVMNGKGRSWARVVATVLGGLNIAFSLLGLVAGQSVGQSESTVNLALSIATLGLAAIILVLLYQRDSTEYYEATTRYNLGRGMGYP